MTSAFMKGRSTMSNEKIIDGRLALIAIQRWKNDQVIRSQFKDVSEYYDWLTMETSTTENIKRNCEVEREVKERVRLKNVQGILMSEFTSDELEDAINGYCIKYDNGQWRGREDYSYCVFFSKLEKKICITNMPKNINDISVEELLLLKNSIKKGEVG